jgi:hypothetical protein
MYPTSVIRKLARSEEMFAETHNFVGLTAHVDGRIDIDAMSAAFDALLEARPVFAGHLERDSDGRHQIVVDDLLHPGIIVVALDDPDAESPPMHLDQSESLIHLRLTVRYGQAEPTLYIHHSLADGHHQFSLIEELFSSYTDLVCTGSMRTITVQTAPEPLEVALAERGVHKQKRSGLERFMPARYAYELPPSRRATIDIKPTSPVHVPVARCRLTERETHDVITFCSEHRLTSNALLSAVVLLAEWQLRNTPNIPVPYIYPVDLRYFLSPPLSATACTNPLGVATYLAEIDRNTRVVDLARDIAETFRADLSDGVIQQSLLHFSPQYIGNAPGLPDFVMLTDDGLVPTLRTPPDVKLTGCQSDMFFAVNAGIDMYCSGIFAERLLIEHHSHALAPEKSVEVIRSLLCTIVEQHAAN